MLDPDGDSNTHVRNVGNYCQSTWHTKPHHLNLHSANTPFLAHCPVFTEAPVVSPPSKGPRRPRNWHRKDWGAGGIRREIGEKCWPKADVRSDFEDRRIQPHLHYTVAGSVLTHVHCSSV